MSIDSRIELLRHQLKAAKQKIAKANKSVERAEAKLEVAQDEADTIQYEIDQELISSWGVTPDWKILLDDPEGHSSLMYDYANSLLNKLGMWAVGVHLGTKQRGLTFSMKTLSNVETQFYTDAINTTLPYIKTFEGKKTYNIGNIKNQDCAYSLSIFKDYFSVQKQVWGSVVEEHKCPTLWAALRHIQENVCDTAISSDDNFIEHQS